MSFFPKGAFERFLWKVGVRLVDFGAYVEKAWAAVKSRAEETAREANRPYIYLADARTAANGCSKEELVREMIERDKLTTGLVCVLAAVEPCKGDAVDELDRLCQSAVHDARKHARFNPVRTVDCQLFAAVLAGENLINGFRNHDVVAQIYEKPATTPDKMRRRCARASRLIAKLRGHGLVAKVRGSRLYRVTAKGHRVMGAARLYRKVDFPINYDQLGA